MTYQPEDPLGKAELMAMEMRRSNRRHLIASKRALRNQQTTEELPMCAMNGGRWEYPKYTYPHEVDMHCTFQEESSSEETHTLPYSYLDFEKLEERYRSLLLMTVHEMKEDL